MAKTKRELAVFAWLPQSTRGGFAPAGLLTLTEIDGANPQVRDLTSEFAYGTGYLKRPDAIEVDPVSLSLRDRGLVSGTVLFPVNGLSEFGGIRDAAPDAWGRRVIEARRNVPANSLSEADYLLDAGGDRVGALDVRPGLESPESPSASDMQSLSYVMQAADAVERGEPVPTKLAPFLGAGPSAGGARPKASVRDDEGALWLAKFPSRSDTFDVARAESCTLELARQCGLTVPQVRYVEIGSKPVMLIRRFDRYWAAPHESPEGAIALHDTRPAPGLVEGRIPFASGLTLMACSEFESRQKSYADLAAAVRKHVHVPAINQARQELFARMVFNIFVSNDDDHLRNHGFIYDRRLKGWVLSPLYDVVPRPSISFERHLHLDVGDMGKLATLDNALSRYTAFVQDRATAINVIRRIWGEVRQWKTLFEEHGAPHQLLDKLESAFRRLEDIASPELAQEIRRK